MKLVDRSVPVLRALLVISDRLPLAGSIATALTQILDLYEVRGAVARLTILLLLCCVSC